MMTTGMIRMSQRLLLTRLLALYGRPWLISLSVVIVLMAVWAVCAHDMRIMICALIVFFIVVPMVMVFLYINHSLSPDVAFNVVPHTVALEEDGVVLTVFKLVLKQEDEDNVEGSKPEMKEEKEEKEEQEIESVTRKIPYGAFGKYTLGADCVYLDLGAKGFMYLPLNAFKDGDEMQRFLRKITRAGQRDD